MENGRSEMRGWRRAMMTGGRSSCTILVRGAGRVALNGPACQPPSTIGCPTATAPCLSHIKDDSVYIHTLTDSRA